MSIFCPTRRFEWDADEHQPDDKQVLQFYGFIRARPRPIEEKWDTDTAKRYAENTEKKAMKTDDPRSSDFICVHLR